MNGIYFQFYEAIDVYLRRYSDYMLVIMASQYTSLYNGYTHLTVWL